MHVLRPPRAGTRPALGSVPPWPSARPGQARVREAVRPFVSRPRHSSSPAPDPSGPHESSTGGGTSSDSDADSDEPGRRVAMAMARSGWGGGRGGSAASAASSSSSPSSSLLVLGRAKAPPPTTTTPFLRKRPTTTTTTTNPSSSTTTADLATAIAASARAAALSSELRAAHDRLPTAGPAELASLVSSLADAASTANSNNNTVLLSPGAHAGTCEFFAYVLPASPTLPAWRDALRRSLQQQEQQNTKSARRLRRQDLANALWALGRLPYYPPAPLPIGFGTPRYARPLAASEPDEWEALLSEAAEAWLRMGGEVEEEEEDGDTEARFLLGLALSRRWAGQRVGDAWLTSAEAREALRAALAELSPLPASSSSPLSPAARLAAALLQVRGAPPAPLASALFAETSAPAAEGAVWPASWGADRRPSSLGAMISAAAAAGKQEEEEEEEQQRAPPPSPAAGDNHTPPSLASTLLHAAPPPPPAFPPSALINLLSPLQLQRVARGLVYLGAVPPDAWLRALADAARAALGCGALAGEGDWAALRDSLAFFASERCSGGATGGGAAASPAVFGGSGTGAVDREPVDNTGLADAVALLDEWCVGGSGAF